MSIELTLLVWLVVLAIVQIVVAFVGTTLEFGLPDVPGGREKRLPPDSFSGRAQRAGQNMLESLVLFAALVLTAEVANRTNTSTGLGAEVFFAARVAYAAVAIVGLPWLRTAIWCVSIAALLLIFTQLVYR
jgi:uncharacterized MAPEG superfamily protein